ncbi:MAG: hypothetical protein ACR2PG_14910 [Hyphomicrobiaceae bacterium]
MIYDLNKLDAGQSLSKKDFDVCIAGAGVAGTTLALKLSDFGQSVLLLEGGGKEFSSESQALYAGKNIGVEYFDLDASRLRFFGGTSGHWAGWCRHLDADDFEAKDHIPYSGWPIRKTALDPYEDETYDILDIPRRIGQDTVIPESNGMLKKFEMAYSPPTRFNEKYYEPIRKAQNIHLVLNANLVDIRLNDTGNRVLKFICRSYATLDVDNFFSAKKFILALGGIENPRVLLNASKQMPTGIGNEKDLVGRFFCEHPHFQLGIYWKRSPPKERIFFAPTVNFTNQEEIANCGMR